MNAHGGSTKQDPPYTGFPKCRPGPVLWTRRCIYLPHETGSGHGTAFEISPRTKALVDQVGPGDNTPLRLKLAGGVSLFSWFAVLYFGRMLPFIGDAF